MVLPVLTVLAAAGLSGATIATPVPSQHSPSSSVATGPAESVNPGATPPSVSAVPSTVPSTPSEPPSPTTPPTVIAIGDSILKGFNLPAGSAWPQLLGDAEGWTVTNEGCNGAGFVQPGGVGDCGTAFGPLIASLADRTADTILITGSSNDFGADNAELAAATTSALARVRAEFPLATIIGISTIWGDTMPPAQLADTNEQVRSAVTSVGGTYVDVGQPLAGHPELLQDDDVHPTQAGQQVLATAIRSRVDAVQQASADAAAGAAAEARRLVIRHQQETMLAAHGIVAF